MAVFSPNKTWFSKCAGSKTTTSIFSLCEEVLRKCPNFIPDKPYGDLPAFGCLKEENQDEGTVCFLYNCCGTPLQQNPIGIPIGILKEFL